MARTSRPGRRARRRYGELAQRIQTSRTIADAYTATVKAYVELERVPRWRIYRRRRLAAALVLRGAEADGLILEQAGRPPAMPLVDVLRRRPWEENVRDSRRTPAP